MRALLLPLLLAGCFAPADVKGVDDTGLVDGDGDGVSAGDDCDDADASIRPGAEERCNGVDDDCDGSVDEGLGDTVYVDADGDGYGDDATARTDCDSAAGLVAQGGDCDDTDGDVHPGAVEACNGRDDDCDGETDDGPSTWFADADGDRYGDPNSPVEDCTEPTGAVAQAGDCDDGDASTHPGAAEACDGVDNDCDGVVDEDLLEVWYLDGDGDGYGGGGDTETGCTAPVGYVDNIDDCDDTDAAIHPGAAEICNGADDDCDGAVDDADLDLDATTASTFYEDADADGYGDAARPRVACEAPGSAVADASDCDDGDAAVNPGATEVCNGVDDDCDGAVDDDDASLDAATATTWYADADADVLGDVGRASTSCVAPSGAVAEGTDCDDADGDVNPSATEVCNGLDDDCDGDTDDADASLDTSTADTWYEDADLDGYGDAASALLACEEPSGYTDDATDCDDRDDDVNPGATEVCNAEDDDCDGTADSTAVCPCAVEYAGGVTDHPYLFCTARKTWTEARSYCTARGYYLATIDDATEDGWIDTTADSYSNKEWWIGLNDLVTEGTFGWASGSTSTYRNWYAGEPNDAGSGEDCTELNQWDPSSTGWNDADCGADRRFVCEAP